MDAKSTTPPSMARFFLWTTLWLLMWFLAITGTLFVTLAALSFFVDLGPLVNLTFFDGEVARTPTQKAILLIVSAIVGVVGIGSLWLRRRAYLDAPG